MTANLKLIAEKLNISISTVSRVVNGKDRVKKETRERVLKALEEFAYTPNEVARSLKYNIVKTIGVIIPDVSNNFYSNVFKGIEAVARDNGYTVILCNSNEQIEREQENAQILLQKKIAGLIITTLCSSDDLFKNYTRHKVPVVFVDTLPDIDGNFDFVAIDNIKAGNDLAEHVLSLGKKKIALITGPLYDTTAADRIAGFKTAISRHGIPEKDYFVKICKDSQIESGYKAMSEILAGEIVPDAVLIVTNLLAYGAMKAILDSGLKVPEDIMLACFDAIDPTGLVKPQITSIVQPAADIGRIACEILIRKLQNEGVKAFQKVILEPELLIKESTCP